MVTLKKATFFSVLLCFLPHCHANIGRQVRLIPPNTYQEIYDTHTHVQALIFEKHVKMCVYARDVKKLVKICYTFGEVRTAKTSWLGGHFFRTWFRRVRGA